MQEEIDGYDPVTLMDSAGYIDSYPFDRVESEDMGGFGDMGDD